MQVHAPVLAVVVAQAPPVVAELVSVVAEPPVSKLWACEACAAVSPLTLLA